MRTNSPTFDNREEGRTPHVLLRITLLRHGQTTANALGIVQGQQGHWPLDETGLVQAAAIRDEFQSMADAAAASGKGFGVARFSRWFSRRARKKGSFETRRCPEEPLFWRAYSSDLRRAADTAAFALGLAVANQKVLYPSSTSSTSFTDEESTTADRKDDEDSMVASSSQDYSFWTIAASSSSFGSFSSSCGSTSLEDGEDPLYSPLLLPPEEDLRLDPRLREHALGAREGRPLYLSRREAEAIVTRVKGAVAPRRENESDVALRVRQFLDDLVKEVKEEHALSRRERQQRQPSHRKGDPKRQRTEDSNPPPRVLVTSHGGCIRTMLESVMGFKPSDVGRVKNGSITEVDVICTGSSYTFRLGARVNCVRHLE